MTELRGRAGPGPRAGRARPRGDGSGKIPGFRAQLCRRYGGSGRCYLCAPARPPPGREPGPTPPQPLLTRASAAPQPRPGRAGRGQRGGPGPARRGAAAGRDGEGRDRKARKGKGRDGKRRRAEEALARPRSSPGGREGPASPARGAQCPLRVPPAAPPWPRYGPSGHRAAACSSVARALNGFPWEGSRCLSRGRSWTH